MRGNADAVALKLACHDPAVHRRLVPGGQQARAVFEAVEQARVEAIGARRMLGVKSNLTAMIDDRFHRGKFDEVTDRADAPIEEAVAMMVRERLTGQAPPPAAKKLVDLWRPFIEDRAGRGLDQLERVLEDQRKFGDAVHDLLESLDMGEDRSSSEEEEDGEEGDQDRRKDETGEKGEAADSEDMEKMSMEDAEASADAVRDRRGGGRCARRRHGRRFRDGRVRDRRRAVAAAQPAERAARPGLPAVHHALRRDHRRRGTVRAGGARPAARLSRQAAFAICRAWSRASPTGCSAA